MHRRYIIIAFSIFLLVVLILGITLYFVSPIVSLNSNIEVSLNSKVETRKFIRKIYLGHYENETYDTSKTGVQDIILKITNPFLKVQEYKCTLEVIDKIPPTIEAVKELLVYQDDDVDLTSYAKVIDNYDKDLQVEVLGGYDLSKIGKYALQFHVKDTGGNESYKDFTLKVIEKPKEENVKKTSKGYIIEERNGVTYINDILIANKTYSLPKDYGNGLTDETNKAFLKMQAAAKEDGLNIWIRSGFRSYKDQTIVYNNWVKKDGKEVADTYSARPGYSEHQSGLAMDLNSISTSFADTEEYRWLQKNAYKYGFIMRYLKEKEDVTGYIYEPWHYRYVGVELAKELYNNGNWITLEEYLGIDSKYQ